MVWRCGEPEKQQRGEDGVRREGQCEAAPESCLSRLGRGVGQAEEERGARHAGLDDGAGGWSGGAAIGA